MPVMPTDESRYAALARGLAVRALDMAVDASPYRPRAGETRVSMLAARPAARLALDPDDAAGRDDYGRALAERIGTAAEPTAVPTGPQFVDGAGHRREVYGPLVAHLFLNAWVLSGRDAAPSDQGLPMAIDDMVRPRAADGRIDADTDWDEPASASRVAGALWRSVVTLEGALLHNAADDGLAALGVIRRIADAPGPGGALHAQAPDDTPDAWVYRELTGLHALHLISQITRDPGWSTRCAQVAAYHLAHTQPDYTTYQPWALACFAEQPETAGFAEQQLHDVQTHLAIEGPGGALLPGLLLADAVAAMDGRIVSAWMRLRFEG